MTVLAIDTSSRRRVVCLVASPEGFVSRALVARDVAVDEELAPALGQLLSDEVTRVVVVKGPGSYTGVRAGMAAALGVAHARGLPLHGVSSLDAVAAAARAAGARYGWALVDAGRHAVYAGRFDTGGVGSWSRVELAAFTPRDAAVYATDPIAAAGLQLVEPAAALACGIPFALALPPLRHDDLRALYGG